MSIDSIYTESINPELAKIGLKKRSKGIFTVDLAPGLLGWVGLNIATKHHAAGEFQVNPIIGVRHQETEKLAAELCGLKNHAYIPPTISRPVGYLMPENIFKTWDFNPSVAAEAARDMAAAISAHGLAFMRSHASLTAIAEKLEQRYNPMDEAIAIRLPIAYLLMGQADRAREEMDARLAKLGSREDMAAQFYRKFADAFRKKLAPG